MNEFGYEFEIECDEMWVASANSDDREEAFKEALNYAMLYSQDGPVKMFEVFRTRTEVVFCLPDTENGLDFKFTETP